MVNWQLTLVVTSDNADDGPVFADLLDAALDPETVSMHRDETGDNNEYSPWQISLLLKEKPDQSRLDAALAEASRLCQGRASDISITPFEKKDWLAENRRSFPPFEIGNFWVYGTHITAPVPEARIGLYLDAGQAFGSGSHATTSACMVMIERHLPRSGETSIADIGCGSGILAMAAAKWNPDAEIIAVDNDIKAVETSDENAARNDVGFAMTCGLSDGYAAELVQDNAPFDMILANILPGPLIAMAADAAAALGPDGVLILSGLLENQQDAVTAAHSAQGLVLVDRVIISGWAALAFCHQGEG